MDDSKLVANALYDHVDCSLNGRCGLEATQRLGEKLGLLVAVSVLDLVWSPSRGTMPRKKDQRQNRGAQAEAHQEEAE